MMNNQVPGNFALPFNLSDSLGNSVNISDLSTGGGGFYFPSLNVNMTKCSDGFSGQVEFNFSAVEGGTPTPMKWHWDNTYFQVTYVDGSTHTICDAEGNIGDGNGIGHFSDVNVEGNLNTATLRMVNANNAFGLAGAGIATVADLVTALQNMGILS